MCSFLSEYLPALLLLWHNLYYIRAHARIRTHRIARHIFHGLNSKWPCPKKLFIREEEYISFTVGKRSDRSHARANELLDILKSECPIACAGIKLATVDS
jgi:hypothetical protein